MTYGIGSYGEFAYGEEPTAASPSPGTLVTVSEISSSLTAIAGISVQVLAEDVSTITETNPIEALSTISDTLSMTDTLASLLVSLNVQESGSISESLAKLAEGFIALAESGIISETISGLSVKTTVSDSLASLDNLLANIQASISETATISDLVNTFATLLLVINEAASGTDSLTPLNVSFSIPEIASGTESLAISNILTILENSGILDSVVKYDAEAAAISVRFILESRTAAFTLQARNTTFTLIPRGTIQ